MTFEEALARVLPADIPHRERLIEKSAEHLRLIAAANEYMNLTRISTPYEAAVKHVLDSVLPWKHFKDVKRVLDAGTGAGFPGIPLSIVLPEVRFTLSESIQKKARFVEASVDALDLANVQVSAERAESLALAQGPEIVAARAVAPVERLIVLFRGALKKGSRLLLYKGPEIEGELGGMNRDHMRAEVLARYELPDALGGRTLVSVSRIPGKRAATSPR
ncbi:MAG: 16S rRNA (guanine(527)-N(7))-methyltransferase RsmG [Acidobacteriota bacterium]|nr:16S rRNA (guanine(527)-N(7))-methyltransferase RsmG [Acidobacteriota bacterium]